MREAATIAPRPSVVPPWRRVAALWFSAVVVLVLVASTLPPTVVAASGLKVSVVATPSLVDPGGVTTWKVTVKPSGGTVANAGFFLELNHTWAHIEGCTGNCQVAGFDVYWQYASLSRKLTVSARVRIGPDGGNGPVTGRVTLSSGSCISGCPASDSVDYRGSATPTPKPEPKPTPKLKPTPRPAPRPTLKPAAKPIPKTTTTLRAVTSPTTRLQPVSTPTVPGPATPTSAIAVLSTARFTPQARPPTAGTSTISATIELLFLVLAVVVIAGMIGMVGRIAFNRRR